MTVARTNQLLLEDIIFHVIQFDNDRTVWTRVSKQIRKIWVQVGVDAINHLNPSLLKKFSVEWKQNPDEIDGILRTLIEGLSPRQTILHTSDHVNMQVVLKYRVAHRLQSLDARIERTSDGQLVAVANKLKKDSQSTNLALQSLNGTWPIEQQAKFVREKFKNDQTISIRINNVTPKELLSRVRNLFSLADRDSWLSSVERFVVPEEILGLDVDPNILAECLRESTFRGQVPFVAALLNSSKRNQPRVKDEINTQFQVSVVGGETEFVRPFLESPCLSAQQLEIGLWHSTNPALWVTKKHFEIIRLLLADPRISPQSAAVKVAMLRAIIHPHQNQAELLEFIKLFLDYHREKNLPLPLESLRMAVSMKGRNMAIRLAVIDLLINDPRVSSAGVANALSQAFANAESQEEMLALMRLLLENRPITSISGKDAGLVLSLIVGGYASAQTQENRIAAIRLLLSARTIPDAEWIRIVKSMISNESDFSWLFKTVLEHPSMTSSRLWKSFAEIFFTAGFPAIQAFRYDDYRTALKLIAEHPRAVEMPVAIRVMVAAERVWAVFMSPLHALLAWCFGARNASFLATTAFGGTAVIVGGASLILERVVFGILSQTFLVLSTIFTARALSAIVAFEFAERWSSQRSHST